MPNILVTTDDILIVGYDADGKDHDRILRQVIQVGHQENLKLNKNKCHFRCTKIAFLGEMISRDGVQTDPKKLHILTEFPTNTPITSVSCVR